MTEVVGGTGIVPAGRTLNQLKSSAAGYVSMGGDADALSVAESGVRDGINELNLQTWGWSLVFQDIPLVAGQIAYTLNQNFKTARGMRLLNASGLAGGRLWYKDPKSMILESGDETTGGDPAFYTAFNSDVYQELRFDVPTNSGFVSQWPTARLWYFRRVLVPAGDEAIQVPPELDSFLDWTARSYVASSYSPDRVRFAAARAERILQKALADDNRRHFWDWSD